MAGSVKSACASKQSGSSTVGDDEFSTTTFAHKLLVKVLLNKDIELKHAHEKALMATVKQIATIVNILIEHKDRVNITTQLVDAPDLLLKLENSDGTPYKALVKKRNAADAMNALPGFDLKKCKRMKDLPANWCWDVLKKVSETPITDEMVQKYSAHGNGPLRRAMNRLTGLMSYLSCSKK